MNESAEREAALCTVDEYRRWLGAHEFPEIARVLDNLYAQLKGESLNAGTPGDSDSCTINGLREQLRRRARAALTPEPPSQETASRIYPPEFPTMPVNMASWPVHDLWRQACLTGWRCAALAAHPLYTFSEPANKSQKNMHEQLREALRRIAGLDPEIDSLHGFNEWGKSDCLKQAQLIAKKSLDAHPGDGEQQASKLTRQEKVGMTELEQLSAEEALAKKALVAKAMNMTFAYSSAFDVLCRDSSIKAQNKANIIIEALREFLEAHLQVKP